MAIIETVKEGNFTPEMVALAAQTAFCLMGNTHQHMVQERCKWMLMNLNLAFKSMANDDKVFKDVAPMLFGGKFAKQATDWVDQLKATQENVFTTSEPIC